MGSSLLMFFFLYTLNLSIYTMLLPNQLQNPGDANFTTKEKKIYKKQKK